MESKMNELILDDGLISDYEFELRMYDIGFQEQPENFHGRKALIYSGLY